MKRSPEKITTYRGQKTENEILNASMKIENKKCRTSI